MPVHKAARQDMTGKRVSFHDCSQRSMQPVDSVCVIVLSGNSHLLWLTCSLTAYVVHSDGHQDRETSGVNVVLAGQITPGICFNLQNVHRILRRSSCCFANRLTSNADPGSQCKRSFHFTMDFVSTKRPSQDESWGIIAVFNAPNHYEEFAVV